MKMKPTISLFLGLTIVAIFTAAAYASTVELPTYAIVSGMIYDVSNPSVGVSGASVTVNCIGSTNTSSTTSGPSGSYATGLYCPYGNTVEVIATKDGKTGSNTGTIDAIAGVPYPTGTLNVGVANVDVSIPEFPSAILPAILSIASFGIISRKF